MKKSANNLSNLGEFGFIARITASAQSGTGVISGIGDDSAVTALTSGMQLLTSTDMLLEDIHFRRSWHDPYRLGRKSLAVNISDIAAMGGIPRWATLSLAIPPDLSLDFLDEFTRGFLAMAAEHDVSLIGGDTCSSRNGLAVSVTILGEQQPDLIVRRTGACPGDDIWVTGTLGDAALGLEFLEQHCASSLSKGEDTSDADFLISRLLDPAPRVAAGLKLAKSGLVTAMIDISDGLLADFGHIAELSGVGGIIRLADLPFSAAFRTQTSRLTAIPYHHALSGGEDYELCFTAPSVNREKILSDMKNCGIGATAVGIVERSSGVTTVDIDNSPYSASTPGFNHFT
ncbi:MAG: thiamine-phosphate kinase [Desulfuromonadales bacterium]